MPRPSALGWPCRGPFHPHSHIDGVFLFASAEEPRPVRSAFSPVLSPPGAVGEKSPTEHTLGSFCPHLFLPQEKWVRLACRALQGQEAPQGLKETEAPLVSVEALEMLGQQVSDGRS